MKRCTKCGVEKELELFSRDRRRADGRRSYCKTCGAEKERTWYEANKERVAETGRAWYEANRKRKSETGRAYYEINRKRKSETSRAWRQANPEKVRAKIAAYHRAMEPADADTLAFMELLRQDPCSYCGKWPEPGTVSTIDHIVPVSQGGQNHWTNLTAACQPCNNSKGAKKLIVWLLEQRWNQ